MSDYDTWSRFNFLYFELYATCREYIELREKTHALRLQFEHEKSMWMTKIRQDALDSASDRQDFRKSISTYGNHDNRDSYSPSNEMKFAVQGNDAEINERDRSSSDAAMKGRNNGDNLFIYEFSEEDCSSDNVDELFAQSDRVIGEDITEVGMKRKRKFSTPSKLTLNKEPPPFSEKRPVPRSASTESLEIKTDINEENSTVLNTTNNNFDDFNLRQRGPSEYNAAQYTSNDDTFDTNKSTTNMELKMSCNDTEKKSVDGRFTQNLQPYSSSEYADDDDNLNATANLSKFEQRYQDDEEICADYFGDHSQANGDNLDLSIEFEKEVVMPNMDDQIIPEMFAANVHRTIGEIMIDVPSKVPFRSTGLKKRHRDESYSNVLRYNKKDNTMSSIESMDINKENLANDGSFEMPGFTIDSITNQIEVSPRYYARNTSDAYMTVPQNRDMHNDVKAPESVVSPSSSSLALHSIVDKSLASMVGNSSEIDMRQNAAKAQDVVGSSTNSSDCNTDIVNVVASVTDMTVPTDVDTHDHVETPPIDGSSSISGDHMAGEAEVVLAMSIALKAPVCDVLESQVTNVSSSASLFVLDSVVDEPIVSLMTGATNSEFSFES